METTTGKGKAITIYDIAKEAGVSSATVSRVLTSNARVSEEKRSRVMELVKKYNFQPNALAKSLSETNSKIIGIMTADVRNPYYANLFVACEQAARKVGYRVILANSLGKMQREEEMLRMLKAQQAAAIIQIGGRTDDLVSNMEYASLVNEIMVSTPVIITGKLDGTACSMVRISDKQSMELIMEHLLSLGHKKIAFIGGRVDVLSTYEKYMYYKISLQKNGIPFDPTIAAEYCDYNARDAYDFMNGIFEKGANPTAVIAVNDFSAIGIMRSISEHGYRVPEDISIVSYDNTYLAEFGIPGLTSIDYHYEEYGEILIQTAISAIGKQEIESLKTISPRLIVRESSGQAHPY